MPDRVSGLIAIAPHMDHIAPPQPHYVRAAERWNDVLDDYEGWEMCNLHFWLTDYPTWLDFFFGGSPPEPHSTKPHEDAVEWGMGTTGRIRVAEGGRPSEQRHRCRRDPLAAQVTQPVLLIHGSDDECQSLDRTRPRRAHRRRVCDRGGRDMRPRHVIR